MRRAFALASPPIDSVLRVCGFGPITAAARTASLLARYQPSRVLLIGIAGTLRPDDAPVGSAVRFREVACDGVGVGDGDHFVSAAEMGWQQFRGESPDDRSVGDRLSLDSPVVPDGSGAGVLLTVCAGSRDAGQAEQRRSRYPCAVAEDMEGFGVAVACALAGASLQIVRGISNHAGDRDHANWQIASSMATASKLAMTLIDRDGNTAE